MNDKTKTNANENIAMTAKHISGKDMKWRLFIPGHSCSELGKTELILTNTERGHRCICPAVVTEYNDMTNDSCGVAIEADLSPVKELIESSKRERWSVSLCFEHGDTSETAELYDPQRKLDKEKQKKDPFRQRLELFEEPAGSFALGERTIEIAPSCNAKGRWQIYTGDRCLRYMNALNCVSLRTGIRQNRLFFKVACPDISGFEWKGIVLTYRHELERDREELFFPAKSRYSEKGRQITYTEIDISDLDLRTLFWDVRMVFEKDGSSYWCHVKPSEICDAATWRCFRNELKTLPGRQTVTAANGLQISIAGTQLGNTTVLVQEPIPYAGLAFRLKERLAFAVYLIFRRYWRRKKIILVYEKFGQMAQDNGFYFFRYCMENNMEAAMDRSIYYVIDKHSSDYEKLKGYSGHVLQFMSFRFMIYALASRLLVSSDNRFHAYAWRASESIIRTILLNSKKLVFLQHGVVGLKRVEFKKGTPQGADLFIASGDFEKRIIVDHLGYKPEQVALTGLARWDVLEDRSQQCEEKKILVMPTWRNWLNDPTDSVFKASEYYRRYMELINSPALEEYLEKYDLYIDFYIHPRLRNQMKNFASSGSRIRLIPFGSEPLNELLMECKMLVTDYSSVCWDVCYQGKPVLFYQFDLKEYNESQGSYMDLEKDLFGDRAETQEELLELLEAAAQSGFELKPEYAGMRDDLLAYIDHDNSRRICEEIMKRGW